MNWILEQPLPLLGLGVAMECILFAGLWSTGRRSILWGMLAVLVITAGLLVLEYAVETPFEQIEATLHRLAKAVETGDRATLLAHISPRAPEIRKRAERYIDNYRISRVEVKSNLTVKFNNRLTPPTAIARFNVAVDGGDKEGFITAGHYRATFEVNFRRENNQWNVTDYVEMSPLEGLKDENRAGR